MNGQNDVALQHVTTTVKDANREVADLATAVHSLEMHLLSTPIHSPIAVCPETVEECSCQDLKVLTSGGADAWNEKSRLDCETQLPFAFTDGCHSLHFMRSSSLMGARHPTEGWMGSQMQSVKALTCGSHTHAKISFHAGSRWTRTGQELLDGSQKQQIAQDVPNSVVDRALLLWFDTYLVKRTCPHCAH